MSVRPRATVSPFVASKRVRRTSSIPRRKAPIYRSMMQKSHRISRTCSIVQPMTTSGFTPNVGTSPMGAFSIWFTNQSAFIWFNSSNYSTVSVPGYSDLAALFDEVKIDSVDMSIISTNDPSAYVTGGSPGSAVIGLVCDYNDHVAPASLGDIQQYADYKPISLANNYIYRERLYPKFLTYALDSAGAAISSTPKRGFIRSNLDIDHNVKKGAFITTAVLPGSCVFTFRYNFVCKVTK